MSNARDPFEMEDGIEDIPVVQKPVQTVNKVANTVVKQTAQQVKATTKAFLSQLYGSSTPAANDNDAQQADTTVDPATQQQKAQTQQQTPQPVPQQSMQQNQTSSQAAQQQPQTPEEAKLEQARRELQQTHRSEYVIPTFGDITSLESDIRKEAQKRKQMEQEREKEKEQEKQKMEELEQKKKQEVPLAVKQAQTKSERRPGAG